MGPRATHNIAVLELPSSVEFISTLEGLCFGTNHEITQEIEWIQCISTGRQTHSKQNAEMDFISVLFWSDKADARPAAMLAVLVPSWWTSQIFLGILYSSIHSKKKICILELKCMWSYGVEIAMINDIAMKYFMFCPQRSLCAFSFVAVGLHLVIGGMRKFHKSLVKQNN